MTDDLVKRLRNHINSIPVRNIQGRTFHDWEPETLIEQAADRIEALESGFQVADEKWSKISARCEALEAALRVAAGYISTKEGHTDQHPQDVYDWIVSAALAGEKKDE